MSKSGVRSGPDRVYQNVLRASAGIVILVVLALVATLLTGAWPSISRFGPGFLVDATWNPGAALFGALGPVIGTLMTSAIAILIAVPLSFGIAIVLTELAPTFLRAPLALAIELLAAIPSLIYGMWGLFVFAPFFAAQVEPRLTRATAGIPGLSSVFSGPPTGIGTLAASLILAIMILPFISSAMQGAFSHTPPMLKESAFGLGATTWEVIWRVVLPQSRTEVLGGILLGLGRALGETMAVTFVIGNSHELSSSLLMPGSTIASVLANEFTEATNPLHGSALIELGLILFTITLITLLLAQLWLHRLKRRDGHSA